jgi:hypothetical protein
LICRRVCQSLSAYIDQELPHVEQEIIAEHLGVCPSCRAEYSALTQTKQLVASLKTRVSRETWTDLLEEETQNKVPLIRTRPLIATAFLSLIGLCLGTNRLTHSLNPHVSHNLQEVFTVNAKGQNIYTREHTYAFTLGSLVMATHVTSQRVAPYAWQTPPIMEESVYTPPVRPAFVTPHNYHAELQGGRGRSLRPLYGVSMVIPVGVASSEHDIQSPPSSMTGIVPALAYRNASGAFTGYALPQ